MNNPNNPDDGSLDPIPQGDKKFSEYDWENLDGGKLSGALTDLNDTIYDMMMGQGSGTLTGAQKDTIRGFGGKMVDLADRWDNSPKHSGQTLRQSKSWLRHWLNGSTVNPVQAPDMSDESGDLSVRKMVAEETRKLKDASVPGM